MCDKRVRTANYSFEDTLKLVEIVVAFKHIVENKRTHAASFADKSKVWEKICSIFNTQTTMQRAADQLRQKYEALKEETRKYYAQQRQHKLATGSGPYMEHKFHIIYNKIYEVTKLSTEGHTSKFDSDALFNESVESPENQEAIIAFNLADTSEIHVTGSQMCEVSVPVVTDMHSTDKTTLQILRSSVHPVLDVNQSNSDAAATTTGTSSDKDFRLVREEIIGDKSGSGRRTPVIRHQKVPVSATARHLEPWANAKKELIQLQMGLLKKQHDETQRREEELFHLKRMQYEEMQGREEQLFQLQRENLELDIKIKEETLKKMYFK